MDARVRWSHFGSKSGVERKLGSRMLFYTILASKIGILAKTFEYYLYFLGALGAATTSGIRFPTMHFLIRFVIMQLPNTYPNRALAKNASQTCTRQIYLQSKMMLAKYIFKSYTCQICIPNVHLPNVFPNMHLPNMHPKWCLPNMSSNRTLAKYASQTCTCQCQIYLQFCICRTCQIMTHLQNRHPNHALAS